MLAFILAVAAAHRPLFPLSRFPATAHERKIIPPDNLAYFDRGNQTYTLKWSAGDAVFVNVYVPPVTGARGTAVEFDLGVTTTGCGAGPIALQKDTEYVPWLEIELTPKILVVDRVMAHAGSCTFSVTTGQDPEPFVVWAGTEETHIGTVYGIGYPILIMFTSAWNKNYTYGYWLVLTLLLAIVWQALKPDHISPFDKFAVATLLATALSRASQAYVVGLGYGATLIMVPLAIAVGAVVATKSRSLSGVVLAAAIIVPTRSWIDVALLSLARVSQY